MASRNGTVTGRRDDPEVAVFGFKPSAILQHDLLQACPGHGLDGDGPLLIRL
jgi:hypothetical protein